MVCSFPAWYRLPIRIDSRSTGMSSKVAWDVRQRATFRRFSSHASSTTIHRGTNWLHHHGSELSKLPCYGIFPPTTALFLRLKLSLISKYYIYNTWVTGMRPLGFTTITPDLVDTTITLDLVVHPWGLKLPTLWVPMIWCKPIIHPRIDR